MMIRTKIARALLVVSGLVGSFGPLGCGDDGLSQRYSVSGKVTYKGQPLEKGEITFMPVNHEGRGGTGVIDAGSYSLTTQTPKDGAFPGEYDVIITSLTVDLGQADAESKQKAEKAKVQTNMPDQAAVAHANASAKNAVPAKYAQIATSGLKAKVEPKSNTFDFALTD